MASNIQAVAQGVTSDNQGSLVQVTVTNNSPTLAVGPLVVTAIYQGSTLEYIWSETIATLAATKSQIFHLSINNETYSADNLHVGVGLEHTP